GLIPFIECKFSHVCKLVQPNHVIFEPKVGFRNLIFFFFFVHVDANSHVLFHYI
ncbi:unnamed protein product, partial [Musa textilis]